MKWTPIVSASLAILYNIGVVYFMQFIESVRYDTPDTILDGVGMISLVVFSAAVMAFLFFYQPLVRLIENKKAEALSYFLQTLGIFGAITATLLVFVSVQ